MKTHFKNFGSAKNPAQFFYFTPAISYCKSGKAEAIYITWLYYAIVFILNDGKDH